MLTFSGSQSRLCSMPVRLDTYSGCSHGCKYCFAIQLNKNRKNHDMFNNIKPRTLADLERFLKKQVTEEYLSGTPIHWGGTSDGFQPLELEEQVSYKALLLFRQYQYPVVISTKGTEIISSDKYLDVLKGCKAVVQISMTDKLCTYDMSAPSFDSRINSIYKLTSNGIKVIVRNQPYFMHLHRGVIDMIQHLDGVYGFTIEGYKGRKSIDPANVVRTGGEYKYDLYKLMTKFQQIKDCVKAKGIKFFAGENRLRWMGDSVNCCGVSGLPGFEHLNELQVTALLFNKDISFSDMPKKRGVKPSGILTQNTARGRAFDKIIKDPEYSYYEFLRYYVNHGGFADEFELLPTRVDDQGNYVFRCRDTRVESARRMTLSRSA